VRTGKEADPLTASRRAAHVWSAEHQGAAIDSQIDRVRLEAGLIMGDTVPPGRLTEPDAAAPATGQLPREIIFPHDPAAGPVTAVRNVVLQFSIAELKEHGYYDRYAELIDPKALDELLSSLGPGWIPVELGMAHYEACERLQLSVEDRSRLGARTGDRLQETTLVTARKKARLPEVDLWNEIGPLHRMWSRLYQGGSVQIVKLGPKDQLFEQRGFPMNRFLYYREGQLSAIASAFAAIGVRLSTIKVESHHAGRGEISARLSWR
jgi:hypothetical protein